MSLAWGSYVASVGVVQVTPSTTCIVRLTVYTRDFLHLPIPAPQTALVLCASLFQGLILQHPTPRIRDFLQPLSLIFPSATTKNVSVVPAPYKKAFYSLDFHLTLLINYFIYLIRYPKFSVFPHCRFSLSLHYLSFLELLPSTPTCVTSFFGRDIAQSVNFLEDRQSKAGRYNVRKTWKKSSY